MARALLAGLVLLAGARTPLAGQRFWRNTFYPFVYYSSIDGVWGAAHVGLYSPIGSVERPEPYLAFANLDAGVSTAGSYSVVADLEAPAWWDGWRAGLTLTTARDNRLGYYGLGNDTRFFADSATGAREFFYRVRRTRSGARFTVQRRIVGPIRLLAGAAVERTNFGALAGETVFRRDFAAGVVDSSTVPFTDKVARAGLVLDTRDHEIDPHTGAFVEALFANGTGYTRTTVHARVQVHLRERLVVAGRLAGEGTGGHPPLAAQFVMEASDRAFLALGGYRSLRGYYDGRFVGRGKLLGGLEARYALLWIPSLLEVKLVGFFDTGRVFAPGEAFRITTDGLHSSGGGELAIRFLRNSLVVFGVGAGSEGARFLIGSTWSY